VWSLLPQGIIVVKWDEAEGTILESKYPTTVEISSDEMMRIFTSHAMGEGKPGFLAMKIGSLNIASYYTGLALRGMPQHYVAILLAEDEDATVFEGPLTETSTELMDKVGSDNFPTFLEEAYKKLIDYLTLTDEQMTALLIKDPRRRLLLQKLTGGAMSKVEAKESLEEELKTEVVSIDLLIDPLVKIGVLKKAIVEGIPSESLFLLSDIFAARLPPDSTVLRALRTRIPENLAVKFEQDEAAFFRKYKVLQEDPEGVAEILTNPVQYKILQSLRNSVSTAGELAANLKIDKDVVNNALKTLRKLDVVSEVSDRSGNRYMVLKNNPTFLKFFPEYMVNTTRQKWASGMLEDAVARKHLELLKETYLTI
jgi:DNA-binding MarR family transcriptional regulator